MIIVRIPIDNYNYTAINIGHVQYKFIIKELIAGIVSDDIAEQVLDEIFCADWRTWK